MGLTRVPVNCGNSAAVHCIGEVYRAAGDSVCFSPSLCLSADVRIYKIFSRMLIQLNSGHVVIGHDLHLFD